MTFLTRTAAASRPLTRGDWLALALATATATAVLHYVFAPGLMSYDSMLFYEQAVTGVKDSTWPPMYTYLIWIVRALGGDYGTLFVLQNGLTFGFGGYLVLALSGGGALRRLLALAAWFAAFVAVPVLVGTLMVLWNVVAVAAALLAGLSFQLVGARSGRLGWALAAVFAYAVCYALRYNSIFLIAPPLLLLLIAPAGARSRTGGRVVTFAFALLAFGAATFSFSHRLPDLQRLPPNAGVRTIQSFDLIGVSACAGRSYLTPEMSGGRPAPIEDIRAHYDPRHVNLSLLPKEGLVTLVKPRDAAETHAYWMRAVREAPHCYARHRWASFREQMGLGPGEVFYPTHGSVHPNRFGYELARPELAEAAIPAVSNAAQHPLRRAWLLYLAAALAIGWAWARSDARRLYLLAAGLAAFAYAGSHLFIAAAADARYIFPSNALCAAIVAAVLGGIMRPAGRRPAAPRSSSA